VDSTGHSALSFAFFAYPSTTEIYTLSLHDALPICPRMQFGTTFRTETCSVLDGRGTFRTEQVGQWKLRAAILTELSGRSHTSARSEEHTSELQSPCNLVCRLLLEKQKVKKCLRLRC